MPKLGRIELPPVLPADDHETLNDVTTWLARIFFALVAIALLLGLLLLRG